MQKKPKILAVDDDPSILSLLKTVLEKSGYSVDVAQSGHVALAALEKTGFDCIITDAIMPEISGFDLVKLIRSHPLYSQAPIIMLTRKRDQEGVKKAIASGITDYVMKPIDQNLLLEKIEKCINKGGGRKHTFELTVFGRAVDAKVVYAGEVKAVSESGLKIHSPVRIQDQIPFQIEHRLYDEIGISPPALKLLSCEKIPDSPLYEAQFIFVGVAESVLKKIRAWIQKEQSQRSK